MRVTAAAGKPTLQSCPPSWFLPGGFSGVVQRSLPGRVASPPRWRLRAWLRLLATDELHLEKISDNEKADAPPDRLQLFFSTHDVTLSGWRLRDFLRLLRDGKVAAVKTGSARYADLRRDAPYVVGIEVTRLSAEHSL